MSVASYEVFNDDLSTKCSGGLTFKDCPAAQETSQESLNFQLPTHSTDGLPKRWNRLEWLAKKCVECGAGCQFAVEIEGKTRTGREKLISVPPVGLVVINVPEEQA